MEPTITIKNRRTGEVKQVPQSQLGNYNIASSQTPTTQPTVQPQQDNSLLKTLLPLIGSIGGGLLGIPLGPAGIIGGGAIGGAGGAALAGSGGGDILKEGAMGAVGGLFPAFKAGKAIKALGAGAKVAEEVAQRPGTMLAAKTLASNFTVPAKIGREGLNIEDAFAKALQDKIPIQSSIGGWSKLANEITGDTGAVTKGMRFAANNAKTPINYDQALTDATNFASLQGEIEADTLEKIRNHFTARNPILPGFISATDAHDVAGQLEKEGFKLIKAYGEKALTPNLAKANKGQVMVGVAEDLRNGIAQAAEKEGLLPQVKQQILQALGNKYPSISEKVMNAQSLPEIRSIAAPYVNISKAADFTKAYQQAPFSRGGDKLALTLAGAGGGFSLGGIGGGIAGAALAPAAAGVAQAATPALTGIAAKGILKGAEVGTKYGPTVIGQTGARALGGIGGLVQPQTVEAAESKKGTNNLIPDISTAQTPQEQLRQTLGYYALSRAKNVSDMVAAYNLLYPKQSAIPQEILRAQTGVDLIGQLKKVPQSVLNRTGSAEAATINAKLSLPGNVGRYFISKQENDLASLEQQYFMLTQGVLTALQGSRPSDYDAKQYQDKAGPSIQFPNYVNQERIKNLLQLLQAKTSQSNSGSIPQPSSGLGF